jgi:hypothetical protein
VIAMQYSIDVPVDAAPAAVSQRADALGMVRLA